MKWLALVAVAYVTVFMLKSLSTLFYWGSTGFIHELAIKHGLREGEGWKVYICVAVIIGMFLLLNAAAVVAYARWVL